MAVDDGADPGGAARVDHHHAHRRPRRLRRRKPLIGHRMAPGEVRPDQHRQIGGLQIVIGSRQGVAAEGADIH